MSDDERPKLNLSRFPDDTDTLNNHRQINDHHCTTKKRKEIDSDGDNDVASTDAPAATRIKFRLSSPGTATNQQQNARSTAPLKIRLTMKNPSVNNAIKQASAEDTVVNVDGDDNIKPTSSSKTPQNGRKRSTKKSSTAPKRDRSAPPKFIRKRSLFATMEYCINAVIKKDAYGLFISPVDTAQVQDYLSVIKKPMDYGTIRTRVQEREYARFQDFHADCVLVCTNAKTYNLPDNFYHKSADKFLQWLVEYLPKQAQTIDESIEDEMKQRPQIVIAGKELAENLVTLTTASNSSINITVQAQEEPKKKYGRGYPKDLSGRRYFQEDGSLLWDGEVAHMLLPAMSFPYTYAHHPRPPSFDDFEDPFDERLPRMYREYGPTGIRPLDPTLGVSRPYIKPEIGITSETTILDAMFSEMAMDEYAASLREFTEDIDDKRIAAIVNAKLHSLQPSTVLTIK